jgi:hypothetical protein
VLNFSTLIVTVFIVMMTVVISSDGKLIVMLSVIMLNAFILRVIMLNAGITKGGMLQKYHCTVDLLFDWFGLVCFPKEYYNCQLPNS